MRVLDVGSGSGYLTHVMAELAGAAGKVVGIEHIKELAELGKENMAKSAEGAAMLESGKVRFVVGDGRKGWVDPDIEGKVGQETWDEKGWDAIHVGAGAAHLHEELVTQLRRPGRYVKRYSAEREGANASIECSSLLMTPQLELGNIYGLWTKTRRVM